MDAVCLAVDSPFFSAIVLFKTDRHFPRVFGGFPERFGSLERMEIEVTPRIWRFQAAPWPAVHRFAGPAMEVDGQAFTRGSTTPGCSKWSLGQFRNPR